MFTKRMKKAGGIFLSAALILPGGIFCSETAFAAAGFSDVKPEYWGSAYIQFASERGIINGYPQPDGTAVFAPENQVSMEEAATMLYRALYAAGKAHGEGEVSPEYEQLFDTHLIAGWARPYVAYALANGIIGQEEIPLFTDEAGRGNPAMRATAAIWTARALGANNIGAYGVSYSDAGDIPQQVLPDVAFLYRLGIMQGSAQVDGSVAFLPNAGIKRSEFAAISNRVYEAAQTSGYDPDKEVVSYRGTVLSVDRENRKIRLSGAGAQAEQVVLVDPGAQIVYNGAAAEDGLSSIAAGQSIIIAAMSVSPEETMQAQIWSGPLARDGIVIEVKHMTSAVSKIIIADPDENPIYYLKTESTKSGNMISIGDEIRFIADGVKLIEII